MDPAQLDAYLNQHWGNVRDKKLEKQESLSLREKVQSFLNQTSDIDGVNFLGYDFCLSDKQTILRNANYNSFAKHWKVDNCRFHL